MKPNVGETWWLNDILVLVLGMRAGAAEGTYVHGLVLLDLDEVFDVGVPVTWRVDEIPSTSSAEPDRRIL